MLRTGLLSPAVGAPALESVGVFHDSPSRARAWFSRFTHTLTINVLLSQHFSVAFRSGEAYRASIAIDDGSPIPVSVPFRRWVFR